MDYRSPKIIYLYKMIEKNETYQKLLRFIICLIVPAIVIYVSNVPDTLLLYIIISFIYIPSFFFIDVHFSKKIIQYKIQIYEHDVQEHERKVKIAEIRNDFLTDAQLHKRFDKPSEEITYPIPFYTTVFVINIILLLFVNTVT